jgi:hypothetical protein
MAEEVRENGLPDEQYQKVLAADSGIDSFIEKRAAKKRNSEFQKEHDLWQASVRRYHRTNRAARTEEWRHYHLAAAERIERVAGQIAASHRRKAEELGNSS